MTQVPHNLFDKLGPAGTVFLRVGFAALLSSAILLAQARGAQVLECKRVRGAIEPGSCDRSGSRLCYPG